MNRTTVTISDVAHHAGVSRAAVSKVIRNAYGVSDAMRERVQHAIDTLGYRPSATARAMRGQGYTLGIEVPGIANSFLDDVIQSFIDAIEETPYQVIIAPAGPDRDSTRAIQVLADRQVDGIVAASPAVDPGWLESLGTRIPLVLLGRRDEATTYDTISDDDALGTRLALEHLVNLGHRDIVHLTITPDAENHLDNAPHAVRAEAYREFMAEHRLADLTRVITTAPSEDGAAQAMRDLLDGPHRPTAVYAGHDELALGVLRAMGEAGLTSREISVVGYDDSPIAAHPLISLTSIHQSATSCGRLAARFLLERINGRTTAHHEVVVPELRARASTTVPRTR
ncbi:MAG: LacI family DNA-binding transcriptional regulator [Arachnia propionica]|uniref:LacI family DNA-binding transcriptional regulator n=1 Tax=Arachnia propionica TaxID=1750 RepID=UPI0026FABF60|nr:LacI family DNA-binding transcriptional regulator [Arachnia propionica]